MSARRLVHAQRGFTLLELTVTVVIVGIMAAIIAPYFQVATTLNGQNYTLNQQRINRAISLSLHEYAKKIDPAGRLPAPYTNASQGAYSTVVNATTPSALDTALFGLISQYGVSLPEINTDASPVERQRVYQRIVYSAADPSTSGLRVAMPIFGGSSVTALVEFDAGVVYNTACAKANAGCRQTFGAVVIPGTSPQFTNTPTWTTTGSDGLPIRVTTLDIQKELLDQTGFRINRVRDQLRAYFQARLLQAPPGDPTNFYPAGSGATSAPADVPSAASGCYTGWYALNGASDILPVAGLAKEEFGVTAWGRAIEYCRDYTASAAVSVANDLPHVGALRIRREVNAAAPAATYLTFTF